MPRSDELWPTQKHCVRGVTSSTTVGMPQHPGLRLCRPHNRALKRRCTGRPPDRRHQRDQRGHQRQPARQLLTEAAAQHLRSRRTASHRLRSWSRRAPRHHPYPIVRLRAPPAPNRHPAGRAAVPYRRRRGAPRGGQTAPRPSERRASLARLARHGPTPPRPPPAASSPPAHSRSAADHSAAPAAPVPARSASAQAHAAAAATRQLTRAASTTAAPPSRPPERVF
jgi:hypothetical protein